MKDISDRWLYLVESGDDTHKLSKEEAKEVHDLMVKALRGELSSPEHKDDVQQLMRMLTHFNKK